MGKSVNKENISVVEKTSTRLSDILQIAGIEMSNSNEGLGMLQSTPPSDSRVKSWWGAKE